MKKIAALDFFFCLQAMAQGNEKACSIFNKINNVMQTRHYKPKPVNDSLSSYVFKTVMSQLDDNRALFLQDENKLLEKHQYKIDDYINDNDCSFFSDFISTYKKALERNKTFIEQVGAEELSYNSKDTMYYSKKTFPFHSDPERIKKLIRKKITFDILEDISMLSKNKDSLAKNLDKLFIESKSKVIDTYLCRVNSLLNPDGGFDDNMYNRFFSAFCSYFDPHSTYFNYNEKASFVSSISSENYSLGLQVSQNDKQEITIEEVVPGGPASGSKKIEKGDKIIKIATDTVEYTVSCASMQTITNVLSSDTYKSVDLTLRKKDGTLYTVNLVKQIMKADDHSVYSYVLGEGKQKTGYIKVPSFYSAFDNSSNDKGAADDVAKEVAKLNKAGVNGLVIDLQFNGGGSMDEVIRLAGMFVNFGPIAVLTDKNMDFNVVRDYNRGMIYSGPMVVLVNGFSASASEFFAGVMQDYNRALIVGSTTVGKATMQTILPLDGEESTDFVKVTVDKFYRVTGKSSQYLGIVPDIELPAYFNDLLPREKTMPTAIKNDSINIGLRYSKMSDKNIKKAIAVSKKRIAGSTEFNRIKRMNDGITQLYKAEKAPLPITYSMVYDEVHASDKLWKEISQDMEKQNAIAVTETISATVDVDTYYKSVNEYKIKSVKADPYILESLKILQDINNKSR
jgi:carboxyl-terminal processing protease